MKELFQKKGAYYEKALELAHVVVKQRITSLCYLSYLTFEYCV